MDRDPVSTAVRDEMREQSQEPDAACAICGLQDRVALRAVTDPEQVEIVRVLLLERHHVLGRANYPQVTMYLCLTHHAMVTEFQRRGAVPMTLRTNPLDLQIASLGNISALLQALLGPVEESRTNLEKFREFLDANYQDWPDRWKEWK